MSRIQERNRERLRALERRPTLRQGVITDDDPLKVSVGGGAAVEAVALNGWDPEVGMRVNVHVWPGNVLILGPSTRTPSAGGGVELPIDQEDVADLISDLAAKLDVADAGALAYLSTVGLSEIASALKPSGSGGSAAAGDLALRSLGTGSTQAAAGNDSRIPTSGQKNALAGAHGTPATGNEYLTKQSLGAAGSSGKALAADDATTTNARTPTAHTHPQSEVTDLEDDLADKAPLADPTFTGNVGVPTRAPNDNTDHAASTAYVQTELTGVHKSDGDPPSSSPTPVVTGLIGSLLARWNGITNNDPVTYEVHVAGSSGFTPDADTLYAETSATQASIKHLPPDDDPLAYETDYYVQVVPKDVDGPATGPYPEASGQLVQATTGDIAPESVTTDLLAAGAVSADKLEAVIGLLGKLVIGEEDGQRIEGDPGGGLRLIGSDNEDLIVLPTDDGQPASFRGDIEANTIDATGAVTFRSDANKVQVGGKMCLEGALGNPSQAPTLAVTWDQLALTGGSSGFGYGIAYASDGHPEANTPCYYLARVVNGTLVLDEHYAVDGTWSRGSWSRSILGPPDTAAVSGVAQYNDGGTRKLYVLGRDALGFPYVSVFSQSDGAGLGGQLVNSLLPATTATATLGRGPSGPLLVTHAAASSGNLKIHSLNPATGASTGSITTSGLSFDYSAATKLTGIVVDGSGNYWISVLSYGIAVAYKFNSSGVYQANNDFMLGNGTATGLTHDGTKFISAYTGNGPRIYEHTDWTWTTESGKYWAAYSWTDGTNETQVSPRASIDMGTFPYRRAKLRITPAQRPSGITATRYYVNRGASDPGGTGSSGVQRQTATTYIDSETNPSALMKDFLANGSDGPASNGFAASGSPAVIEPSGGTGFLGTSGWRLRGNNEMRLPVFTTAQRASLSGGVGLAIFNSDTGQVEVHDGSGWGPDLGSFHPLPAMSFGTSDQVAVANRVYFALLVIPAACPITGIQYIVGSVANGNVRAGMFDAAGNRVAQSTSNTAQGSANSHQKVAFSSAYTAAPGVYWICIQFSSSTGRYYGGTGPGPMNVTTPGAMGIPSSITPVTTPSAIVPYMQTY